MARGKTLSVVFKSTHQNQAMLLPPDLNELIAINHPVRIVNEVLERVDVSKLLRKYKPGGTSSYHPRNEEEGDLYGCWCVVKENVSNSLSYFENIYARSLNELYKNTFVHFFGNKGNPACNAIKRFSEDPHSEKSSLLKYRKF